MTKEQVDQLLRFYACDTLEALVDVQALHVERLQEKLYELQPVFPAFLAPHKSREQGSIAQDDAKLEALQEAVLNAAYEWQQFVTEDNAPMNLQAYMQRAWDAAIAAQKKK